MDDEILKIIREAEKNGKKGLSIDTISILSDFSEDSIRKRIKSMEAFGLVEKKTSKKTSFWGMR